MPGTPCTCSPPDARADNGVHHDETLPEALETLARVGLGPEDGLRTVLHAANALTSQGGLVVYVGGPVGDDDARTLSALRQPGSAGAAMVVDPEAFAGRTRKGAPAAGRADATLATLQASGWMTTPVDTRTTPALAWAAVVGGQVVGAR